MFAAKMQTVRPCLARSPVKLTAPRASRSRTLRVNAVAEVPQQPEVAKVRTFRLATCFVAVLRDAVVFLRRPPRGPSLLCKAFCAVHCASIATPWVCAVTECSL